MGDPTRKWFFLHLFNEGFDTLEIAKRCQVSEAAVYNGIHHAREYNRQQRAGRWTNYQPTPAKPNFDILGVR